VNARLRQGPLDVNYGLFVAVIFAFLINLGFLFVASFGELILLVWLIGWGTRLSEPATNRAPS